MYCIYCITNKINNKKYVGKTTRSIEKRWKEHCLDYNKRKKEKRPLYLAFKKYGIQAFTIELLEECSKDILSEREIYWISKLDTYKNGYNATLGGDGTTIYNDEKIIDLYLKYNSIKKVSKIIGCCVDTISIILHNNNIKIDSHPYSSGVINKPKKINQYSLDGTYIQTFDSIQLAAEWLLKNNKIKVLNSGVRGHISKVAIGKAKSAYKYCWKY